MSRTIKGDLSDIPSLIAQLKAYKKGVATATEQTKKDLADVALNEARRRFGSAIVDGEKSVAVAKIHRKDGWAVVASGKTLPFIEFGAGVFYNGTEPYPQRPAGVLGIGEYGKGLGKQNAWAFTYNGQKIVTRGTPASMPMYHAKEQIYWDYLKVAKRNFKNV